MCAREKKSSRKRWKKGEVRGRNGSSSEKVSTTEENGKESRSCNKRRFITFSDTVCVYGFWVSVGWEREKNCRLSWTIMWTSDTTNWANESDFDCNELEALKRFSFLALWRFFHFQFAAGRWMENLTPKGGGHLWIMSIL